MSRISITTIASLLWIVGWASTASAQEPKSAAQPGAAPKSVAPTTPETASPVRAVRPLEQLLPNTTVAFVAVSNIDQLSEHWNKTQLGQLAADPSMEPFSKDFRAQLEKRWTEVHLRLGLSMDDLKGVAGGESALATIRPAANQAAIAFVVDVTGRIEQAAAMLQRVSNNLIKQGAKQSMVKVAQSPDPVVLFERPPLKGDTTNTPRRAYYFLTGHWLGAADNLEVLQGILSRLPAERPGSLANVDGFRAVMQRCAADAGNTMPQIRWYVHPVLYAEVMHTMTPEDQRRRGKSVAEVLQNQGFGAILGVGGFVDFAVQGFEVLHRSAVFAPDPKSYTKSMKMIVTPNQSEFAPQPWVPADVATYSTFYVDIVNGFDNFGPLFDELFGGVTPRFRLNNKHLPALQQGTITPALKADFDAADLMLTSQAVLKAKRGAWEIRDKNAVYVIRQRDGVLRVYQEEVGVWEDVLQGMKEEPNGPQIDLRNELIRFLGPRVTVVTDTRTQGSAPSGERLLFAIQTSNPKQVAAAIDKWMKSEPNAKRHVDKQNRVIWEMLPDDAMATPKVSVGNLPSLTPDRDVPPADEEEAQVRLLPHAAVTVEPEFGQLLIASHPDYLKKILEPTQGVGSLAQSKDYASVQNVLNQLGIEARCAQTFSRTDEEFRTTYELVRQGKMPQSETVLARVLNALSSQDKRGTPRKPQIEGSKLPDYEVVRGHLGPAGMVVASEANGWFFKGVMLNKQASGMQASGQNHRPASPTKTFRR